MDVGLVLAEALLASRVVEAGLSEFAQSEKRARRRARRIAKKAAGGGGRLGTVRYRRKAVPR